MCGSVSLKVFDAKIIEEDDPQLDVGAVELRRQGLEGVRCADGGHGGVIERFFAGGAFEIRVGQRHAAVGIDLKGDLDNPFIAHHGGFGHDGIPIPFNAGKHASDVAVEIDTLGGRKNRNRIANGGSAPAAATSTAAPAPSGNGTAGTVSASTAVLECIRHLILN